MLSDSSWWMTWSSQWPSTLFSHRTICASPSWWLTLCRAETHFTMSCTLALVSERKAGFLFLQVCKTLNSRYVLISHHVQSEYGTILKALSTTNTSLHGCYLEELRILPEGQIRPIKSLQILHSDRSLFVGLDDRLVKIPLERCSNYPTERYDP